MLETGKITTRQLVYLVVSMVLPTAVLFVPAITTKYAKQDAWLAIILATLIGLVFSLVHTSLGLKFPRENLIQYLPRIIGRYPGRLVGLAYAWWWLHMNSSIVRQFGELMTIAAMPKTPLLVFSISILFVTALAVRGGLEVIARTSEWVLPIFLGGTFGILVLILKDLDFHRLLPVLEEGLGPVVQGSFTPTSWMGEVVTVCLLIPYLNQPQQSRRATAIGISVSGFVLTLVVVTTLALFGSTLSANLSLPFYELARAVDVANFLQRSEPVILAMWVMGNFIKIAIYYFACCLATAELLGLSDYRPLVTPIGVLHIVLSILLYDNIVDLKAFISLTWPPYAIILFEFGTPLLLLVVAVLRGVGSPIFRGRAELSLTLSAVDHQ